MKNIKRVLILLIVISVFVLAINITTPVQAFGNAVDEADQFVKNGGGTDILNPQGVYDTLNLVYGILVGVAIAIAVIRGIIIGMQIIFGSLQDRADAKALIIPYLWIVLAIALGSVILRAILTVIMTAVD